MPRKTPYGKYIISAGDVGAYTVCPEAWRLKLQDKSGESDVIRINEGIRLHKEWAESHDEALFLSKGGKIILLLILILIIVSFLR